MNKSYDTKEIKVVPLSRSGRRPFTIRWSYVYIATTVFVVLGALLFNFMFILYPNKVESYNLATSIDTSELLSRLSQVKAQATPEMRVYSESSNGLLSNLDVFHVDSIKLRDDNDLPGPVLSPADVTDPTLYRENASFSDPSEIAGELSSITSDVMKRQEELSFDIPKLKTDSENIAWVKAHTPSRYPVPDGVTREITSDYGWRIHPVHGYPKFHEGIDMHGVSGEEIFATADGTVTKAGWFGGYGLCIIIVHRNEPRIETRYGHLIRGGLKVKVGDVVKRGDVIGLMGSTGVSTGTHIHYEVRVDKQDVDPKDYTMQNWSCGGFPWEEQVSE